MRKNKIIILLFLIISLIISVVGCGRSTDGKNPSDIIEDAYGNQQFSISFYSENLDNPIPSLTYSSKNIPNIPVPERVGYIFQGWYFDKNYKDPFSKDLLLMHMEDITLYAKWQKEGFENEGIYDIEITSEIFEILSKGELADKYELNDLTKDLVYDEASIEKSEKGLLLKISYNVRKSAPFAETPPYNVLPAKEMGDKIYVEEKIVPDNNTKHVIFFNIDKLNLSDTIYLEVRTINYDDYSLTIDERKKTAVNYVVAIKIKKIIGFTTPFIDPDLALEKNSYYLVKTHYNSMAEMFNPVYSYIKVDNNGNYTLIKPFMPYTGVISVVSKEGIRDNYLENFYHRGMSFSPMLLYYRTNPDKDYSNDDFKKAEYLPQLVNGEYYGDYTIEFHADTGTYYMIYDLGKDLKKEFIISGATTGFMEITDAMGRYNIKMTIDYNHIVQVPEIDYKPLEGDSYVFKEETQYYPGNANDLNTMNLFKDLTDKNGISTNMINFFYSAKSKNTPIEERKIHSHKICVKPTGNTNSQMTKDARYKIATFDIVTNVYGYSQEKDGNLYADSMTVTTYGDKGQREKFQIKNGKMLKENQQISLKELFENKVNPYVNYKNVKATIYNTNNGIVDYNSATKIEDINTAITYNKPIAVLYTYKDINGIATSLVYLENKVKPKFIDEHVKDGYLTNRNINFYDFSYTWGENFKDGFTGFYYAGVEEPSANPVSVALFSKNNEAYNLRYLGGHDTTFQMSEKNMLVCYELSNQFREKQMVYLEYNAELGAMYQIKEKGEVIVEGYIRYDDQHNRVPLYYNNNMYARYYTDLPSLLKDVALPYSLNLDGEDFPLDINYLKIYTSDGAFIINSDYANQITDLVNNSKNYCYIMIDYSTKVDSIRRYLSYNLKVNGKDEFEIISDDFLFTEYTYIMNNPTLILPNNISISNCKLDILDNSYGRKYEIKENNGQYSIKFFKAGNYSISYSLILDYDEHGNRIFNGETINLRLKQRIVVEDINKEIDVTYITDDKHPFSSNIPAQKEKRDGKDVFCYHTTHNLKNIFVAMGQYGNFVEENDSLYAWSPKPWSEYNIIDTTKMFRAGVQISDVIKEFGSNKIEFYSFWDKGITYTVDMNTEITGQTSYTERKKLSEVPDYQGWYAVYTPKPTMVIEPDGWIFTGWTILETGEFRLKGLSSPILTREPITIKATFVRDYLVRFDVGYKYGYGIPTSNAEQYQRIKAPAVKTKDDYKFVGFRLATEVNEYGQVSKIATENFDFNKKVDEEFVNFKTVNRHVIILVAVFEDENGNEVWQ